VENYDTAPEGSADGSERSVRSNAHMRARQPYGAGRALRHIAVRLAKLVGPSWPLVPVAPSAESARTVTACAACGGDHVCPMDWGELDELQWWVDARCGDCGAWFELVLSNAQAATLDVALDRQVAQIRSAADRLDAERMADQVDAFVTALDRDLIGAGDF
jgi:hypothetical protein